MWSSTYDAAGHWHSGAHRHGLSLPREAGVACDVGHKCHTHRYVSMFLLWNEVEACSLPAGPFSAAALAASGAQAGHAWILAMTRI